MQQNNVYVVAALVGVLLAAIFTLPLQSASAERIPFAFQNVTQSVPADLVEGVFHIAIVLPEREDGKFYHGEITYTSSHALEVNVLQPPVENETIPRPVSVPGLNASITALGFQEPSNFNTVPFVGSEVTLLHRSSQPFTASYSIVGEMVDPEPLAAQP
jgi:hypothetical protein